MAKRKKIYIDRSKWRTGCTDLKFLGDAHATGRGNTELINSQGFKCCLGFICQQAGPRQKLTGKCNPGSLDREVPAVAIKSPWDGLLTGTSLTRKAMTINDDETTTARTKERKLRSLFKDSPYQLVFEGEYTVPKGAKS